MICPLVQFDNLETSYEYYYREMDGTAFLDPRVLAQYYLMYADVALKKHHSFVSIALIDKRVSLSGRGALN